MTTRTVPIEHRLLGLDRRLIAPTLGVGLVVVLWAVLVPWIASQIGYDDSIEPGTVLDAGGGVTYVPAAGWELVSAEDESQVRHAGLTFTVRAGPFDGELPELLAAVNEVEDIVAIVGPQSSVTNADGVAGLSEAVDGPNRHGEVVVFAQNGVGVEVVVWGPKPGATTFGPEIDAMIRSISFAEVPS